MLPQEPFLMKRSVLKNVSYGLKLRGNDTEFVDKVKQALSLVGLDSETFAERHWNALSVGETQRVALAARLVLKPKALLLDEPTASVDAASAQLIKEATLRARQELGTTLIIASHDWQWLHEICDEILHLFKGRIFGSGRETIMFGPWQRLGAGEWGKILSDTQQLIVPPPPSQDAAAVIDILSVGHDRPTITGEDIVLSGTVSRLSLEKKTGRLFATIFVGDFPFSFRLAFEQVEAHTIFPGKTIFIRYRPAQIKWI